MVGSGVDFRRIGGGYKGINPFSELLKSYDYSITNLLIYVLVGEQRIIKFLKVQG